MGAYGSSVMQSVWPRLALSSYGEGANMAKKGSQLASTRVKRHRAAGAHREDDGESLESIFVTRHVTYGITADDQCNGRMS